ncbi:hypothetical protein PR048_000721 [Dryococelus australis]|uniref:Uncharacterized protein n=1 Tax=Dryococelus australis TaxID=614101 RepID=A0ABQ9IGM7_9NEOP|nr:hypothetical protein PR048_000721 [Dryococelus australis]
MWVPINSRKKNCWPIFKNLSGTLGKIETPVFEKYSKVVPLCTMRVRGIREVIQHCRPHVQRGAAH